MSIIDSCVHPSFAAATDINRYMPKPYSERTYNPPLASSSFGGGHPCPIDEYIPGSWPLSGGLPGSDPTLLHKDVIEEGEAEFVILLPLGRGLLADVRAAKALDAATNEWIAQTWLNEFNSHGRYRGSIRVDPRSPSDAVREIDHWAAHPYFVQVTVPLESHLTYGEQPFFQIWEAACEHKLPIIVHSDHGAGVLNQPTVLGYPLTYFEAYSQSSLYASAHVASLIAHGVFDRLESLVFVFADGGFDYLQTLIWRLDKDWRSTRSEVPWMTRRPSDYLKDHIRFVVHQSDGSQEAHEFGSFIEANELASVLMYGSNYPHWDHLPSRDLADRLPETVRSSIMADNARELYGL